MLAPPRAVIPAIASEPASALRRCANAPRTTVATHGIDATRPGAIDTRRSSSSTESTFGTGRNTDRDTARTTLTSQESWASTEGTP